MYFSGKISNSVLTFLDKSGENLEGLYDLTDLPVEFLRDPSSWLEAHKLEKFLASLDKNFGYKYDQSIIVQAGHGAHKMRSWGVLDSVLKIMEKPYDTYLQPKRFLSYFVSPELPIVIKQNSQEQISFELPIFYDEFPLISEYLKSALEGLPQYLGQSNATVSWEHNQIKICWVSQQASLISEEDLVQQLKPELVRNLVANLEKCQLELERKNEEMSFKDQEILRLKADINNLLRTPMAGRRSNSENNHSIPAIIDTPLNELKNHFLIMNDYLSRAQQIMTLLIGQSKNEAHIRMAVKRTGWDQVVASKAQLTRLTLDHIENLRLRLSETINAVPLVSKEDVASPDELPPLN